MWQIFWFHDISFFLGCRGKRKTQITIQRWSFIVLTCLKFEWSIATSLLYASNQLDCQIFVTVLTLNICLYYLWQKRNVDEIPLEIWDKGKCVFHCKIAQDSKTFVHCHMATFSVKVLSHPSSFRDFFWQNTKTFSIMVSLSIRQISFSDEELRRRKRTVCGKNFE